MPHRIHLDPDQIRMSQNHHLKAVPGDQSDDSDEWCLEESEEEWGPGDVMYRDYRRMQRSPFLVAHVLRGGSLRGGRWGNGLHQSSGDLSARTIVVKPRRFGDVNIHMPVEEFEA